MTALLLEPHQDDAVLFASFTLIRERPDVITVLADARNQQGVTGEMRNEENRQAFRQLGVAAPVVWRYRDDEPDWEAIQDDLVRLSGPTYRRVFAPWPERGGHEQHNRIGEMAVEVFGSDRVTFYTTYVYGGPRTRVGVEVDPDPEWIIRKHRALACFESQILHGPRRFFMEDLREYVVDP